MRPLLDDLELPQVQEIATHDRRMLSEHKPAGMEGSLLQNLGRRPMRLVLWGVAVGSDALDFVDKLDGKFRAGKPVPFVADIVKDSQIEQMAIDDLRVQELAGKPQRYAYVLMLREFIPPPEPEAIAAAVQPVDRQAQQDAATITSQQIDNVSSEVGVLEVQVDLEEEADYSGMRVVVEGETSDGQTFSTWSDEQVNGLYRFVGIQAGDYTVKVEIQ